MTRPRILPIPCRLPRGSVTYVYYVHAQRPALIDAGVAASPESSIGPALRGAGLRLEDIELVLLTHGHWDHLGGAYGIHAAAHAQVAIHAHDAPLLARRAAHLDEYMWMRFRFADDPDALARTEALLLENVLGELGADRELRDSDTIDLGDAQLTVVDTPGHSRGSVSFLLEDVAFTGDAVQAGGTVTGRFPFYADGPDYRRSLLKLRDDVRPAEMHLGHDLVAASGRTIESHQTGDAVRSVLDESLAIESTMAAAASAVTRPTRWQDFAEAASTLGYRVEDRETWPAPLFLTLSGYGRERA